MTRGSTSERGARRGFSLVELMVALVIASIVMYGVYMLYENSSAAFRVQNQLTDLFQNVRFGAEHLKRDIERVGFLATSNSDVDASVVDNQAARPLYGLIVRRDGEDNPLTDTVHEPTINQKIYPTSITLFGDFWSRGAFRVHSVSGARIEIDGEFYYDENTDGFDTAADMPDSLVLTDWFRVGRLVRWVNSNDEEFYYAVIAFSDTGGGPAGNWPVITLNDAIPQAAPGVPGVTGFGTETEINPVGYLRYRIAQDTRADAPADKYDLIREELSPDDFSVVPRTQLAIAEYAVDLQFYDFVFDEGTHDVPRLNQISDGSAYPNVERVVSLGGTGRLGDVANPVPHRLRALTFKLSVRTPDEDPNLAHIPRQDRYQRLRTFDAQPTAQGASRVRSVGGRIVLENFLLRNLLP